MAAAAPKADKLFFCCTDGCARSTAACLHCMRSRNGMVYHHDFIGKSFGCKIHSRSNKGLGYVYLLQTTAELYACCIISLTHRRRALQHWLAWLKSSIFIWNFCYLHVSFTLIISFSTRMEISKTLTVFDSFRAHLPGLVTSEMFPSKFGAWALEGMPIKCHLRRFLAWITFYCVVSKIIFFMVTNFTVLKL